jgi:hypothetical protein
MLASVVPFDHDRRYVFASVEPIWNCDCDRDYKELMIFPLTDVQKDVFGAFTGSGRSQALCVQWDILLQVNYTKMLLSCAEGDSDGNIF